MKSSCSITGDHTKCDLRYTQNTIRHSAIFTNNIWSYLLWSPVNSMRGNTLARHLRLSIINTCGASCVLVWDAAPHRRNGLLCCVASPS